MKIYTYVPSGLQWSTKTKDAPQFQGIEKQIIKKYLIYMLFLSV